MKKTITVFRSSLLILALCVSQQACLQDDDSLGGLDEQARGGNFQRGLVYHLDGDHYHLHGPLENGLRDIPGHYWKSMGGGWYLGQHYNTGPFGIPKWWSSDAADGQLLYTVVGKIDTWTPENAQMYESMGFSHYHELMNMEMQLHPSKVIFLKHVAVTSFTLDGGSKPWQAHSVTPGVDRAFQPNLKYPYPPREKYLYIITADKGGSDPDFLAVIGADPNDPDTFSKIIHRVDMPGIGDELHHFGYNIFQNQLLIPGLFSGRLHLVNVSDDPARPYMESYHDNLIPDSGYIVPHTVIGTPDGGYMVSMIGSATADTAPGGIVRLDQNTQFVAPFGPGSNRDPSVTPPTYMYDMGINVLRNRMVTTSFGLPANVAPAITTTGLGNEVYVWDYKKQEVTQVVDIGAETGALEVRWLHDPGSTIGFTNAPGTSEIWRWEDRDLDGHYDFSVAVSLPPFSIPTDMVLSKDDKYMYVANWVGDNVMQFDISDPFNPVLVSQVAIPHAQMLRLSPDNKRLYVTNSLLSTWDDTEFPEGVTRNSEYGLYLVDIDYENGGMTINTDFYVDFDNVQKKNSVGPARPHQVFFDPNVRQGFGDH